MFGLGDGFPPDDCNGGFEFEDDDEDLTIDIETIYRILDEKPDSAEVLFACEKNFMEELENFDYTAL